MKFSLNTKIVHPSKGNKIKNAVILLHGYGGDGNDISILTLNWKRFLPNTIFFCPDGHEVCSINPSGFQWFDLSRNDNKYILAESIKAEEKINLFVNEIKQEYNLDNSKICLSGFSQGCMMSINVGLTSSEKYNCILGFSGKIIDKENLLTRIKSKTKIFLTHGDMDEVVPSNHLLEAKDFFIRNKIDIETKLISNCDHHISVEASSAGLNFIKKNLKI
tara:strand:- start:160 stop:816 length:657 start_codon:yes stop_codon:yes gene_type:complete